MSYSIRLRVHNVEDYVFMMYRTAYVHTVQDCLPETQISACVRAGGGRCTG